MTSDADGNSESITIRYTIEQSDDPLCAAFTIDAEPMGFTCGLDGGWRIENVARRDVGEGRLTIYHVPSGVSELVIEDALATARQGPWLVVQADGTQMTEATYRVEGRSARCNMAAILPQCDFL